MTPADCVPRSSSLISPTWSRTDRRAALEARLDQDDAAAEDFDFARADYRILIALREDYLAHLESVKAHHALDHAEPDAPRAHDGRAGVEPP